MKQLELQLEQLNKKEYKPFIKQHFYMTFARPQRRMCVYAKRIWALYLAKFEENSKKLENVFIPISDVVDDSHIKSGDSGKIRKLIKEGIDDLASVRFWVKESDRETIQSLIKDDSGIIEGSGHIIIIPNQKLRGYYLNLKHYTPFELSMYMKVRSWYTQKFIEILSTYRDTGYWKVSIDKYRDIMATNIYGKNGKLEKQKYPDLSDLIRKTTQEPLKELKGTYLEISKIERLPDKSKIGRGRKPTKYLCFYMKQKSMNKIPDEWWKNGRVNHLLKRMKEDYNMDEEKIVRYSLALGSVVIKEKLDYLDDIKKKNGMTNPKKYATKTFYNAYVEQKQIVEQSLKEAGL